MTELTPDNIRAIAPSASDDYVRALIEGRDLIEEAGILKSNRRLVHFTAQMMAETGGLRVLRESLTYTTTRAIRRAWSARARKHSDEWIRANLLRNPVRLGDWAYGGRMGNRKGTTDGYDYRGGGFLQTTGKWAVRRYAKRLGIEPHAGLLDNQFVTLQFALLEWREGNCNRYADKNNLLAISRIINVGKVNTTIEPNGMDHRERYLEKCFEVIGDGEMAAKIRAERHVPLPKKHTDLQTAPEAAEKSRTVFGVLLAAVAAVGDFFKDSIGVVMDAATEMTNLGPATKVLGGLGVTGPRVLFVMAIAGLGLALYARLDDAKKGSVAK